MARTMNVTKIVCLIILLIAGDEALTCYQDFCFSNCDPVNLPQSPETTSCNTNVTSCQLAYTQTSGGVSIQRTCSQFEECASVYTEMAESVTIIACCEDDLCNTNLQSMSAVITDGSEEGFLCYECYSDQPDGTCGHVVNSNNKNLLQARCEIGCQMIYYRNPSTGDESFTRGCMQDTCTPSYLHVGDTIYTYSCCTGDLCNTEVQAMGPKAGVDEPLCYSCQDRDEKGICGENVDDSSPLMTKTVCKEGCMMSHIHNRELRTDHFARGCAINCTSALVSTDETLIATSCCEGDLCNTDLEAMNPKQSDMSRCYVCVGFDEDGDCGNKIRPEGGFKLTQICEYGCLTMYTPEFITRSCVPDEIGNLSCSVVEASLKLVGYEADCCKEDLCNGNKNSTGHEDTTEATETSQTTEKDGDTSEAAKTIAGYNLCIYTYLIVLIYINYYIM